MFKCWYSSLLTRRRPKRCPLLVVNRAFALFPSFCRRSLWQYIGIGDKLGRLATHRSSAMRYWTAGIRKSKPCRFVVACPTCGASLKVPGRYAAHEVECPSGLFTIDLEARSSANQKVHRKDSVALDVL